jgi:hypothetical protein
MKADEETSRFIEDLYDINKISQDELNSWVSSYGYQGFNRMIILKWLKDKIQDVKIIQQIIMVCGLLGPQRASQTKLMNGRVVSSYGIPASGAKGTTNVSCQRIISATADLCAYFLKNIAFPKRIQVNCPAWLQFPSAGSIDMPDNIRQMHIEFCKIFSPMIGGVFNEQIYQQMALSTYLHPGLKLFEDINQQVPMSSSTSVSSSAVPLPRTVGSTKKAGKGASESKSMSSS